LDPLDPYKQKPLSSSRSFHYYCCSSHEKKEVGKKNKKKKKKKKKKKWRKESESVKDKRFPLRSSWSWLCVWFLD
jgi:hypothetical protein